MAHLLTYSIPATFVNASSNMETKCRLGEHVLPDSEDVWGKISYAASDAFGGEESRYDTNTKTR